MSRIVLTILMPAMLLNVAGCHLFQKHEIIVEEQISTGQPVDYFLSPHYFKLRPSRVILMIPKMRNNSFEVQTKFADAVHRHLNQKGIYEVILKTGYCEVDIESIRRGTFDERHLLDITKQFAADGILFCEVSNFSAYEPLQMGCSLTFVDMRESIVTLHTNGFWNTNDNNVARKFLKDVCKKHRCKQYAADVHLKSPSEFLDFVAKDLTDFLQGTVYQGFGGQFDAGHSDFYGPGFDEGPQYIEHW